ncbi:hypothetical protein LNQ82_07035 [Conchiformibius steedae DSM 2580]|uniref:Uncharacterized protein n=1 Tax=Conchiformibius steedae DSM 2580 TaxID=1121352 RepID=A0AAE9HSP7_9NEIS|nr:hypothetical protein [Conchiformibius steedae]QMT34183.1 hypothetical protein H3L98_04120 [Conchiformibius steedae]URD66958.1 hypothetical protein LNQ82_07035 [Conchiformibius steedae DSM 2580]
MGIIFDDISKKDGEFIHAAEAMEYLIFVERNQVNFRQVGEFLHKYDFDEYFAGHAYHRDLMGVYYDADVLGDDECPFYPKDDECPFYPKKDDTDGEYSPSVESFIQDMCKHNSVLVHDWDDDGVLYTYDFNLFFDKKRFVYSIKDVFAKSKNLSQSEIDLPSLDDFLTRRNQEQPNQEPSDVSKKQPEPTAKTRNKQAEIIAALAIMYTKKDGTQPYEMAETIRQEWQRQAEQLGNPPDKNTLAKYIQHGLERLQS